VQTSGVNLYQVWLNNPRCDVKQCSSTALLTATSLIMAGTVGGGGFNLGWKSSV
jgi:hypothetical protein